MLEEGEKGRVSHTWGRRTKEKGYADNETGTTYVLEILFSYIVHVPTQSVFASFFFWLEVTKIKKLYMWYDGGCALSATASYLVFCSFWAVVVWWQQGIQRHRGWVWGEVALFFWASAADATAHVAQTRPPT